MKPLFKRQFWMAVLSTIGLLSCTMQLSAQSTARLQGTVTDPSGAVVPGAKIEAQNLETDIGRNVVSDAAGNYSIPSLPPGPYKLQVTAAGFSQYVLNNMTLLVDQTSTINVKLNVSSTGEIVEVEGSAPLIDSQTVTVGQVINQQTVQNIPLNGRHFLDLTQLVPGSVTAPASGNLTSPSRGLGANSFNSAGAREDANNIMVNGINLNDLSQNQITFQPSINTTQEFKISNSTYGAEYGRSSGTIVNIATRSGTNQFHGEVFDYIRNNDLDARNYFNPTGTAMNTLQRNNFGAAVGGPIFKNRTFFFISYEGLRQAQQINLKSGVLNTAQRNQMASSSKSGSSYAGLLNLIPTANDATGTQFIGSAAGPVKINQYTVDLSHQISVTDQLHLYYAFQQDNRTEPNLQGNTLPGFGDHRDSHRQIGTINETHIFSSSLVNEARLGFNRIAIAFSPKTVFNPSTYGISTGVAGGLGLPQISVTGFNFNFGGPSGFPQGRYDTSGVLSDTLSYLYGKHSIKTGGEFRRVVGDNFSADPGTLTFSSVSNFINGQVNTFTITPSRVTSRIFVNSAAGFISDTYHPLKTLTLELGFRFEWNGTPTEGANRFVNFLPSSSSLVQVGTNGYHEVYNQNYNYEPRVGFSWDVLGNTRTVLHGAYGYLADQPTINAITGLASNPPFAIPVSYSASTTPVYVGTVYQAAGAAGLAPNAVNPKLSNAYTESFNLNLEQQLGKATALQIGYIGSLGRHLRIRRNINQPTINGTNRPYPTNNATSPQLRGGSLLSNISETDSNSFSDYNALWFTVRQNLSHGVEFSSTYTWSKSMDLNSLGSQGVFTLQDNYNPRGNYGLSDFDARDRLVFSGIWSLPFHGNRVKNGWQLANITQLQTGNPFNVTTTSTYNGSSGTIRPNLVGAYSISKSRLANGNVQYLNALGCGQGSLTSACTFYAPTTGFGNFGRNSLTGPGFADSDVSLQKETVLIEGTTLQFRVDVFDFLNHPSFSQPSASFSTSGTTATNSSFGQISATRFPVGDLGSSRQLQFALKLRF